MIRPAAPVSVLIQPASPLRTPPIDSPSSFRTASESPPPSFSPISFTIPFPSSSSSSFASTTTVSTSNLALKRPGLNKKRLSLVLPAAPPVSNLLPLPPSPLIQSTSGSRSLPPSPTFPPQSLASFIGPEPANAEERDRTIGRLMMREKGEMKEQLTGNRGMRRRRSIPSRLDLSIPSSTGGNGASAAVDNGPMSARIGGGSNLMSLVGRERSEMLGRLPSAVLEDDEGSTPTSPEATDEEEPFPYAFGPREILPGIFLGSEQNARDSALLAKYGFGAVLNVAKEVGCPWIGEAELESSEDEEMEELAEEQDVRSPSRRISRAVPSFDPAQPPLSSRPLFVRPVASTPNLQSAFQASRTSPPPPPVPSLPTRRTSLAPPTLATLPSTTSNAPIFFPAHKASSRPSLSYLWLKWGHDESDLVEAGKLDIAFAFLDQSIQEGKNVLVHCQCGVSRSATVVIAYAMREAARALERGEKGGPLENVLGMHDTYSFVKEKSSWVGPNLGLVFQLVAYERVLRGDLSPNSDMDVDGGSSDTEPPYQASSSGGSASTASLETPPPPEKDDRDNLSPLVHGRLSLSDSSSSVQTITDNASTTATSNPSDADEDEPMENEGGTFVFAIPPRLVIKELSPFPSNITHPPPTPFQFADVPIPTLPLPTPLPPLPEIASPPRRKKGNHTRTSSLSLVNNKAFPSPARATILTSTPTATAFSLSERPSAAQVSLWRGGETSTSNGGSGSGNGRFGAQQSLMERRASHRRVFSVPSV